jgi:hypothetical protein
MKQALHFEMLSAGKHCNLTLTALGALILICDMYRKDSRKDSFMIHAT